MKKTFCTLTTIFLALTALINTSKALEIDPDTGNYLINTTTTFTLIARPPDTVDLLSMRLQVFGGTIQSLTINSAYDSAGACTGGLSFITDNVCVDISPKMVGSAVPPFVDGAEIGQLTVIWGGTPSTGRIVKLDGDNGNFYINTVSVDTFPDFGTAGTYIIGTAFVSNSPTATLIPTSTTIPTLNPSTDNLPPTSSAGDSLIFQGVILMVMGSLVALYIKIVRNEEFQQ